MVKLIQNAVLENKKELYIDNNDTKLLSQIFYRLLDEDLIFYNIEDMFLNKNEYFDKIILFYQISQYTFQNLPRSPKYGPSSYQYFVGWYVKMITEALIINENEFVIIPRLYNDKVVTPFVTNGIMKFIQDPDNDNETAMDILNIYNETLAIILEENNLSEYIDRLSIDISFE